MPPLGFEYELSWEWIESRWYSVGVPMYLGALILGIISSAVGYFVVSWLWTRSVKKRWALRIAKRKHRDS
jgi:uncharacterized protein (DUF2062 family)